MAEGDFTGLSDNLSSGAVSFITPGGLPTPPGGGSFIGAWRSQTVAVGNHALFYNGAGFVPFAKGGLISAALKRSKSSSGPTGFSVWVFLCLGGTANTANGYMLGLADASPAHLVVRKGVMAGGLPDVAPGNQGVIWRSSDVFTADAWVHVMLMAAANGNGDQVITVWRNDLTVGGASVATPTWVQEPGVNVLGDSGSGITDDAGGIATGSASLVGGRMGFGFSCSDVGRVAMVDYIQGTAQS